MKIALEGPLPDTPQRRVKTIAALAKEISRAAGEDDADATMALLTAACHMAMQATPHMSHNGRMAFLAERLGNAYAAAEGFFALKALDPNSYRNEAGG